MDNTKLLANFPYLIAVIVVLLLLTMHRVFYVHRHQFKLLNMKNDVVESMLDYGLRNPYANTGVRGHTLASDSLLGSQPGTSSEVAITEAQIQSGFLGGHEPPVFYDIGDVRAARTMRGTRTGYMVDAQGSPVYDAEGNPVMASKASDYVSYNDRIKVYGQHYSGGSYNAAGQWVPDNAFVLSDSKKLAAGWTIKNGQWVPPAAPTVVMPVATPAAPPVEPMWNPVSTEPFDDFNLAFGR